ncbi:hypothetical protein EYC84_002388 [Monilinia fructicola]|uniref:Uncharacterized protein n=1 Tax=Monilinia fructicola TaxID=38448 RepID=A0A5M9JQI4_MONFR|nr:hypothetical protein EYC84_002388 [Monilinia fructicola]
MTPIAHPPMHLVHHKPPLRIPQGQRKSRVCVCAFLSPLRDVPKQITPVINVFISVSYRRDKKGMLLIADKRVSAVEKNKNQMCAYNIYGQSPISAIYVNLLDAQRCDLICIHPFVEYPLLRG